MKAKLKKELSRIAERNGWKPDYFKSYGYTPYDALRFVREYERQMKQWRRTKNNRVAHLWLSVTSEPF